MPKNLPHQQLDSELKDFKEQCIRLVTQGKELVHQLQRESIRPGAESLEKTLEKGLEKVEKKMLSPFYAQIETFLQEIESERTKQNLAQTSEVLIDKTALSSHKTTTPKSALSAYMKQEKKHTHEYLEQELKVQYLSKLTGRKEKAQTSKISPNGAFIRSRAVEQIGAELELLIILPQNNPLPIHGRVLWNQKTPKDLEEFQPSGFEISFIQPPEEWVCYFEESSLQAKKATEKSSSDQRIAAFFSKKQESPQHSLKAETKALPPQEINQLLPEKKQPEERGGGQIQEKPKVNPIDSALSETSSIDPALSETSSIDPAIGLEASKAETSSEEQEVNTIESKEKIDQSIKLSQNKKDLNRLKNIIKRSERWKSDSGTEIPHISGETARKTAPRKSKPPVPKHNARIGHHQARSIKNTSPQKDLRSSRTDPFRQQKRHGSQQLPMEKRQASRFNKELSVSYSRTGEEQWHHDHSTNQSLHGLFVQSKRKEKMGQGLKFRITLPEGKPLVLYGTVVWTHTNHRTFEQKVGFGIKWMSIPDEWFDYIEQQAKVSL